MSIDIDGFTVFKSITTKRELFPDIKADITKSAKALIIKQLKSKTLDLENIKSIAELLTKPVLIIILDSLSDTDAKSLAKKIDKENLEISASPAVSNRKLIIDLSFGTAFPSKKIVTAKKAKAPKAVKAEKVKRAISSEAMNARWDGKNPDKD